MCELPLPSATVTQSSRFHQKNRLSSSCFLFFFFFRMQLRMPLEGQLFNFVVFLYIALSTVLMFVFIQYSVFSRRRLFFLFCFVFFGVFTTEGSLSLHCENMTFSVCFFRGICFPLRGANMPFCLNIATGG